MTSRRSSRNRRRSDGRFTPPSPTDPVARPLLGCRCAACVAEDAMLAGQMPSDPGLADFRVQFLLQLEQCVDEHGIFVQFVDPDPPTVPWAYTIGRVRRDLPELVVVGVHPSSASQMLTDLDRMWTNGAEPSDEVVDHMSMHWGPIRLLCLPDWIWEESDYVMGARAFADRWDLETRRSAYQVVWSDTNHHFPWEPECSQSKRRIQPLIGLAARKDVTTGPTP